MKLFTRTELETLVASSKNPNAIISGEYANVISLAYMLKMDITVDEVRQVINVGPHPDPTKGAKYIWEDE